MRKVQILGTGCPKCKKLAESAEAAAKELSIEYKIEKVTDINEIMKFGVMMTPGLAVDNEVTVVESASLCYDILTFSPSVARTISDMSLHYQQFPNARMQCLILPTCKNNPKQSCLHPECVLFPAVYN